MAVLTIDPSPLATPKIDLSSQGGDAGSFVVGEPAGGGRTSAWANTPLSTSTCFATAGSDRSRKASRRAFTRASAASLFRWTSSAVTSGHAEASPDTAPTAPAASPSSTSGSKPMKTSRPSTR